MAPHLPPDTEVAGWLHTLGIVSRCQWDVLVFLSRHQTTLLGAESLAQLLGYAPEPIVAAVECLESLALVARSRVSQGARLYQCIVPPTSPRGAAFARLQALADHHAGRVLMATQLRRADRPPEEPLHASQRALTHAHQGRQAARPQADARAERRQPWRKAI
jgi:hypothetical protein